VAALTATQPQLDLGLSPLPQVGGRVLDLTERRVALSEPKGVVYTKPWVVDLILDLGGYRPDTDLATRYAVEPSAGEGAFLVPMVRRLLASLKAYGRPLSDAAAALHAYELEERSARTAVRLVAAELTAWGAGRDEAARVADGWVTVGDYLLASRKDRKADLVVGNPPYIRYDDLPEGAFESYQRLYPTMVGRCDIYVGFIEAGVRQLAGLSAHRGLLFPGS